MRARIIGIATIGLLSLMAVGCSLVVSERDASPEVESLTVDFTGGLRAAQTRYSYDGTTRITVLGNGQASGTESTDAFYVFTDSQGKKVFPKLAEGWALSINGVLARNLILKRHVPPYDDTHTYTFLINAPGGRLDFGVDDGYTADNSGDYTVIVHRQP